jgi:hypothetical protein
MNLLLGLLVLRASAAEPPVDPLSAGTLDPAAEAAFADAARAEIDAAPALVEALAAEARKRRDADALACLEAKGVPLRTLVTVAKDADASLRAHLAGKAAAQAELDVRKIAVVLTRVRTLVADARACIADTEVRSAPLLVEPPDVLDTPVLPSYEPGPCGGSMAAASPC